MSKKIILTGTEARKALQSGVNIVVDAVQTSYGPAGRNSIIEKSYGSPEITNDGVTIAKAIELEGFANLGAKLIIEAANKTNDIAGDGTSLTTILSGALINEGIKVVESGSDPVKVKKGLKLAALEAEKYLNKHTKSITTEAEMAQVATISSRSSEIGSMIAKLIKEVGTNGVVSVSDGESNEIETIMTKGMQFDKGYKSPYFVTDTEKMEAVTKKPSILVTDHKVTSIQDVLPLIEQLSQSGKKELVIIADDIEGEALATFVLNKVRGIFSVYAVQAPLFGDKRKSMLEDIAVLTGATFIASDLGMQLKDAKVEELGNADTIVMTKDTTTIVGGKGSKKNLENRIITLQKNLKDITSDYEKKGLSERIAKLSGGVAVIKVGAATEVQMKELKFQVEDAVNATKVAVAEGIVPGGASTLIRIAKHLESIKTTSEEEKIGVNLFRRALITPFRAIAKNSGVYDISILVNAIENSDTAGYDFSSMQMVDNMITSGIIDPVVVLKQAISNATSIASSVITTEVAMIEDKDENSSGATSAMGGGMGGMGY